MGYYVGNENLNPGYTGAPAPTPAVKGSGSWLDAYVAAGPTGGMPTTSTPASSLPPKTATQPATTAGAGGTGTAMPIGGGGSYGAVPVNDGNLPKTADTTSGMPSGAPPSGAGVGWQSIVGSGGFNPNLGNRLQRSSMNALSMGLY